MTRPKFFMVKGRGPATVEHEDLKSARVEASRLARKSPGEAFFIMEAVEVHRKVDVDVTNLREDFPDPDDLIPF